MRSFVMLCNSCAESCCVVLCRYASAPLSGLGADGLVSVADVLFARSLRQGGFVLWAKDPAIADLGIEEKEGGAEACYESLLGDGLDASWCEGGGLGGGGGGGGGQGGVKSTNPSLSQSIKLEAPGAYRSICVELKLHHLAVSAVDKAQLLSEMEGASSLESMLGGGGGGGPAFKALKQWVEQWLVDAGKRSSPIADNLLQHLYRWVRYMTCR